MIFNVLWTILLGIIGGIISSLIVSRVFAIHSKYQEQLTYLNRIIRKLGSISAYLDAIQIVFEVSYDEDIAMEKEIKEKGYKSENEYYMAHKEKRWISKNDIIETFIKELQKCAEAIKNDILNSTVEDNSLSNIMDDILKYVHEVSSIQELTFSKLNDCKKRQQSIMDRYEKTSHISGKTFFKSLILLSVLVILLIICTCLTGLLGL